MRIAPSPFRRIVVVVTAALTVAGVAVPRVAALRENPFVNAGTQLGTVAGTAHVQERAIEDIVGQLIKGALSLIGVFFFGYLVWAGYLWMTAHGEEEKITQAKKMISGAVIGLVITLAAYAITVFIVSRLTGAAGIQ